MTFKYKLNVQIFHIFVKVLQKCVKTTAMVMDIVMMVNVNAYKVIMEIIVKIYVLEFL